MSTRGETTKKGKGRILVKEVKEDLFLKVGSSRKKRGKKEGEHFFSNSLKDEGGRGMPGESEEQHGQKEAEASTSLGGMKLWKGQWKNFRGHQHSERRNKK